MQARPARRESRAPVAVTRAADYSHSVSVAMLAMNSLPYYPFPMADVARTADPAEALELAIRGGEPVILERDGHAVAAIVPIDLFEKWFREGAPDQRSLIDERLGIAHSVPDDGCAKPPLDGAEYVDRSRLARVNPRSLDIDAAVLADWLAAQASDRLWTVDGEPRIQEVLPLPCSGSDLAAVLKNRGGGVRVFGPDATREPSAADLAGWAEDDDSGLVFELAWLSDGEPGDHWIIAEDILAEEADRAASRYGSP